MKFLLFLFVALASCRAANLSDTGAERTECPALEISFVNSDANYLAIMNAVSEIGSVSTVRYPVGSLNHPFNVVSVNGHTITEYALIQFRNKLSGCIRVVGIYDNSLK